MLNLMTQNWWAIALRGLVAVLFGIAAFMWPGITLWVLVALFGAYALFNGIFTVIEAFSRDVSREHWRPLLFEGVVGSAIGVVTFIIGPWLNVMGALYLIAFWAIMTGPGGVRESRLEPDVSRRALRFLSRAKYCSPWKGQAPSKRNSINFVVLGTLCPRLLD
jgi:short repeat uncharacterized protein DUF308